MPWEVCKDGVCVADPLDPDWKLDLSPSALPDGQVGVQYRQQLEASGGQGPVTFALASGKLPPGLALDASGLLSGTPSAAGKFAFEVSASDGAEPPMEGSLALSLVVAPAKLAFADATLPDAIVNVAYSASLTASGGTPPYSFAAVSGTDVPGLSLAADGTVSGVPTLAGAFAAVVEVSDSAKPPQTAQAQVYLTVLDSLAIAPSTLARATIDEPYEAQLQGVGGTPPYLIELAGGALPPGIDLDTGGLLGGVPTATGDFAFDLRVVDAHAREALQPFTLTVLPPAPVFASHPLPEGMVGQPYSAQLEATGGLQPLVFQARAGHLPPGLQLTQQGALEGTPESSGNYELAFLVIDAAQSTAVATFELTILDALQAGPLPDGVLGRPYSALVEVSGGRAPIELQLDKGSLPDGLELSPSGLVSGVPREVGRFDFQVLATDSSSPAWSLPLALSIEILPGSLAILEDPLPRGIVGVPYSAALLAEGGIEPLSWRLVSGALPPGLVLEPSGAISGAPTDEGTFDFAAEVIDAAAPPQGAIAQLQIVVTNPLRIVTTSLPEGIVGAAYAARIEAAGGAAPYAFRLVEGSALPAGLSLAEDGAIGGMPVIAGTVAFTVEALDFGDPASAARAELSIGVSPDGLATPLGIVTTSLPSATVGRPYSARIEMAGGTRPYFVSLDSGTVLPEGLMLSDAGDITGTPLHAGVYSLALRADDSSVPGQIALRTLGLVVQPESGSPLALLTTALPDAELGVPYQVELEAAGGTQPYRFGATETSRLPSGLYIDASGLLQGTPLAAGVFTFTAAVWDASTPHQMATTALTLTVRSSLPGGNLTIVSTAVRKAKVALPYSQSLMALGGSGAYEWRLVRGVMPPGLQLSPEGLLSGVPTARGTFPFALEVRDTVTAAVAQADLFLTVMATGHAGVRIMPAGLPDTTVGAPYSIGLHGVGGSGPYDFALSGASPGLALTVETATRHTALEGVAEVSGLFRTVITATDTVGATGMLFDLVSVRPAAESLLFSTTMLPDGKLGLSYALQLGASGGEPPYSFAEARGTRLPDGLALQPSGLIHGVPLQAGEEPVILRVTDGSGQSAEAQFWLLIQQ